VNKHTDIVIATGTAEVGGWTTRELLSIIDGLEGLDVVGADVGRFKPCSVLRMPSCRLGIANKIA
jgi:hypothetical protein